MRHGLGSRSLRLSVSGKDLGMLASLAHDRGLAPAVLGYNVALRHSRFARLEQPDEAGLRAELQVLEVRQDVVAVVLLGVVCKALPNDHLWHQEELARR